MHDLSFNFGSFSSTTIEVSAVSDAGREFLASVFGLGAVSVNLPKSKGEDFALFASRKGMRYEGSEPSFLCHKTGLVAL